MDGNIFVRLAEDIKQSTPVVLLARYRKKTCTVNSNNLFSQTNASWSHTGIGAIASWDNGLIKQKNILHHQWRLARFTCSNTYALKFTQTCTLTVSFKVQRRRSNGQCASLSVSVSNSQLMLSNPPGLLSLAACHSLSTQCAPLKAFQGKVQGHRAKQSGKKDIKSIQNTASFQQQKKMQLYYLSNAWATEHWHSADLLGKAFNKLHKCFISITKCKKSSCFVNQ